jgi:hypothetical protein
LALEAPEQPVEVILAEHQAYPVERKQLLLFQQQVVQQVVVLHLEPLMEGREELALAEH